MRAGPTHGHRVRPRRVAHLRLHATHLKPVPSGWISWPPSGSGGRGAAGGCTSPDSAPNVAGPGTLCGGA
eukprot:8428742-Lingulodinium_polyedra.AAC.1